MKNELGAETALNIYHNYLFGGIQNKLMFFEVYIICPFI